MGWGLTKALYLGMLLITTTSGNVDVYNNTSYNNNLDTIWAETCRGEVFVWGNSTNVVNNVLYAVPMNTGKITDHNSGICWAGIPDKNDTFSHNLTFNGTVGQNSVTVQGTTNDTVNLNAIIANNTLLGTDPKLANVGTKDFYPLAGSPVLGGGTPGPLGYPAYTVDGFEQPSPPNIGALAVRP